MLDSSPPRLPERKQRAARPESITSARREWKSDSLRDPKETFWGDAEQQRMNGDNAPGRHEQQSAVNPKLDCLLTLRTYIPTYKTSERHYGNCCNRIKNPFTLGGRGGLWWLTLHLHQKRKCSPLWPPSWSEMLRNDADVFQSKATCLQINIKKPGNFLRAESSSRSLRSKSPICAKSLGKNLWTRASYLCPGPLSR